MQHPEDAGRIRNNNDVVVENGITHETVHVPPSYKEIPQFIEDLCSFFNEQKSSPIYTPNHSWHSHPLHDFVRSPFCGW